MQTPTQELVDTIVQQQQDRGATQSQARAYALGYIINLLDSVCGQKAEATDIVAWHVRYLQTGQIF